MKLSNILRNNQGLTLIEVLVSVTILSTVLLVFLNFFFQAGTYTNMNQKKTVAVNVARNVMMHLEKQSYVEMREYFEDVNSGTVDPDNKYLNLFVCNNQYRYFSNTITTTDAVSMCAVDRETDLLISINEINFMVSVVSEEVPAAEGKIQELDYYIPITVEVRWIINDREYQTRLDGKIKSEDIR
jgi:prepilin-type N-terminal cleavage/methylation domain-containing protein